MSSERGDAAAKLLLILLVCAIAGAVASPWLLRAGWSTDEQKAIATLRRIHAAQADYYGGTRLYASMPKLTNTKLFDGSHDGKPFKRDGYQFTHTTAGSWQRWCAQAAPDSAASEGRIYAIDESGIVKEFPAGTSPCYAGELQSPGSPIK
jgi:type II secretory pathway pseudopilin PulG